MYQNNDIREQSTITKELYMCKDQSIRILLKEIFINLGYCTKHTPISDIEYWEVSKDEFHFIQFENTCYYAEV